MTSKSQDGIPGILTQDLEVKETPPNEIPNPETDKSPETETPGGDVAEKDQVLESQSTSVPKP